jgi:stage V sporulation protein S
MEVLKVSAKSNPNSVAGALAGVLRGFVAPSGVDLVCIPAFTDIEIDGEERTGIKLIVQPR